MTISRYEAVRRELRTAPRTWLVTGVAGFIGSNLLEELLGLDQRVVGLDNFSTGHQRNLDEVRDAVGDERWARFRLLRGDIRELDDCHRASEGVDHVLHQAALGSVPRSIEDPVSTNATNIGGHLHMLVAARGAGVKSFTYAASSSTYGDHPALPKVEGEIGRPLSPYAVTKYVNELYAEVFARSYGFGSTGLRYFNVFGKRQDPAGQYAAVIPRWVSAMLSGDDIFINGDGETSRDFCYVANAVQANILAAMASMEARSEVLNVAVGERTSLKRLFSLLRDALGPWGVPATLQPSYRAFRVGDVRHSQADISKAARLIAYEPTHRVEAGIAEAVPWYAGRAP